MNTKNSITSVAEQLSAYNNNVIQVLSKLSDLVNSQESSITVSLFDQFGVTRTFNVPTVGFLKTEIDRLNNNINSLYGLNQNGAFIQPNAQNLFKKIIVVDLNMEPSSIGELNTVTTFKSNKNWFFDSLVNPTMEVQINLNNKVEDSIRKCLVRRYIVDFNRDENDNITNLGQAALDSYNNLFRGRTDVRIDEFEQWHKTTPGIVNPLDPNYDEEIYDLEPNNLLYNGTFTVLSVEDDALNAIQWYHLDTLSYINTVTGDIKTLSISDEVILNTNISNSRYKVMDVNTASSDFRVRFQRIEGNQPIPVGIGILKIYSPISYNKNVSIRVGYNERNVVFIKPMDANTHLLAKNWSLGVGYWTNDLVLSSGDDYNGSTMERYYSERVYDYGLILEDLVQKKIPSTLAGTPNVAVLNNSNFKVVQINKHQTDTPDSKSIKDKYQTQQSLISEINQLTQSITDKSKQVRTLRVVSSTTVAQLNKDLDKVMKDKDSKTKLLSSVTSDIVSMSSTVTNQQPIYRLRGFWNMPEAVLVNGSRPQEVVQFRVQYKRKAKDGSELPVENFKIQSETTTKTKTGAFSNWVEFLTDARKRVLDKSTGLYTWQIQDISDADTPNINQLDIPIAQNESIEIRIKSISEVGWPDAPFESDWSDSITISFPDELSNVLSDNQFILQSATQEDLKVRLQTEYTAKGLDDLLNNITTINNKTYYNTSDKVLSGFKDDAGQPTDLYGYLQTLQNRIISLEEKINRAKGELKISVFRNNVEFPVQNGANLEFNIECEDYLNKYQGSTGRVYVNNVYTIKEFVIKVLNTSVSSPLGLLSSRSYNTNQTTDIFNASNPQVFWVNEDDELLYDNNGNTRTQLNNQFIWSLNHNSLNQNSVIKLSDSIGGNLVATNNSLVNIMKSNDFNVGYSGTTLAFKSNNSSMLEISKWLDTTTSVASTTRLLSTVHPVVKKLDNLVETNSSNVKVMDPSSSVVLPINVYFKLNSLDPNQSGNNFEYINLNNTFTTVRQTRTLRMFLENESENRPFVFTIKFNLNRNRVALQAVAPDRFVSIENISPRYSIQTQ